MGYNVRMLIHDNCPIGDEWKYVKAVGPETAVKEYVRTYPIEWRNGSRALVEVMEDGFVGEPFEYKVSAYFTHDTGRLAFRTEYVD